MKPHHWFSLWSISIKSIEYLVILVCWGGGGWRKIIRKRWKMRKIEGWKRKNRWRDGWVADDYMDKWWGRASPKGVRIILGRFLKKIFIIIIIIIFYVEYPYIEFFSQRILTFTFRQYPQLFFYHFPPDSFFLNWFNWTVIFNSTSSINPNVGSNQNKK